ncbi:MAG: bifunctional diguanylate cyclase/phosphodiesterase [Methylovulum sp.]|nr:bifunctional diguanylate cyclase/phosphodiesterase [Methylovulum sp.]
MSVLHDELVQILDSEKLTPLFQPIVSLMQKDIIGYEALIRSASDSPLHNPFVLFNTAERFGLSAKLEFSCQKISIKSYVQLNLNKKLFINVSPSALLQSDFKAGMIFKFLKKFGLDPKSVVIELTETQPINNYKTLRNALMHYRNMGFEVALDDLGAGYSELRLWSELLPDYLKIAPHFIQGIHDDPIKLNFVGSIQSLASSFNCNLIAEGIETENDFKAIKSLGVPFAQGYYFARPMAVPLEKIDSNLFIGSSSEPYQTHLYNTATASQIAQFIPPVSSETPIREVMSLFQHNNELSIVPLVDNNVASGIVFRDHFLSKLFFSRYGLELYGKKPIHTFVSKTPLSIDHNTPIESVSQLLTSATEHDPAFIVTRNGEYAGLATLLDLLEEMTRQQIKNAKHANPLTLLPGSVPVNEYINQLLARKTPFAFAYFDLDNFKPFNDVYGYSAGDDIIKAVAETLTAHVSEKDGLVGHIGGDDFIVVFICNDWLQRCENILARFEALAPTYYKDEDVKAGGIHSENRAGGKSFFPVTSLSVGIVDPTATRLCQSHVDIADFASGAKKQAKKIDGNSYYINQRNALKPSEILSA